MRSLLHDPPSKALDIANHTTLAEKYRKAAYVDHTSINLEKPADHKAAAADRLPFPNSKSKLRCALHQFLHPFVSEQASKLDLAGLHAKRQIIEEAVQNLQPVVNSFGNIAQEQQQRAQFFAHWRLWRKHLEEDAELAKHGVADLIKFLPADTRIPDHSIWHHICITSAFSSLENRQNMALLKLQLGPVQDFIAAARTPLDLRSGSYLLSWLMAAGLKAVTAETGPDSVIYPYLLNQPLYDLQWKNELWEQVSIGNKNAWASLGHSAEALRIPNLPNVCLLLVPAEQAEMLAQTLQQGIRREWQKIADSVWQALDSQQDQNQLKLTADEGAISYSLRKQRFEQQVANFLSIDYAITPFAQNMQELQLDAKLAG